MSARSKAARLTAQPEKGGITVPRVPPHVVRQHGSAREWKALKRKQCRAAVDAVGDLRIGSAFFPRPTGQGYSNNIDQAQQALMTLTHLLSQEVWGR